jgi:hypothetical protein
MCQNAESNGVLSNGFANGAGTAVSETGTFGTGAFTEAVTGLPSNTTIYWKAYAINGNGSNIHSSTNICNWPGVFERW